MTATAQLADLRFPVGKFDWNAPVNEADYPRLIAQIAETPGALRSAVAGLSRDQLETLLEQRRSRYEEADQTVDVNRPLDEVATEVLRLWSA